MIDPDRLNDLLHDVKAALLTGFATAGVALPDRVYVANGDQQVAFDCEQVTVAHQVTNPHGGNVAFQELSGRVADPAHAMRAATIAVTIVRCAPTMTGQPPALTIPTVAEEEASAQQVYADGQLALNALLAAQRAGDLTSCSSVLFLDLTTPGSSGGYASSKLRVVLGLE